MLVVDKFEDEELNISAEDEDNDTESVEILRDNFSYFVNSDYAHEGVSEFIEVFNECVATDESIITFAFSNHTGISSETYYDG
jgi:uncharacterized OsmC-like protein